MLWLVNVTSNYLSYLNNHPSGQWVGLPGSGKKRIRKRCLILPCCKPCFEAIEAKFLGAYSVRRYAGGNCCWIEEVIIKWEMYWQV